MTWLATTDRASGVLLHVSSLPSRFGIGDLGPEAYRWIDFLARARQRLWQVLPLNPTMSTGQNSPYQAASAFAGNPLLISPELLHEDGLLEAGDLADAPAFAPHRTDYPQVTEWKRALLRRAGARAKTHKSFARDYDVFRTAHASWLDDYALYSALRERYALHGHVGLEHREATARSDVQRELGEAIDHERFLQFVFHRQWFRLKQYANERGLRIVGDLPYYVGLECADVWANPKLFKLDESRRPMFLAGVPPDRFSESGQLWNSPVYDWAQHQRTGYAWWVARLAHNLELFDVLRVDHFRGFAAYWEVPAAAGSATEGRWVEGPGRAVFDVLRSAVGDAPLLAEDLGHITDDVRRLMEECELPSMNVMLFSFDDDNSPHALHNHAADSFVYTGTHDNNTVRGWFEDEAGENEKRRLAAYIGRDTAATRVHWDVIRMAMMSVSRVAMVPMPDLLGLGSSARMNRPSVDAGNWEWRLAPDQMDDELAERLGTISATYGRTESRP